MPTMHQVFLELGIQCRGWGLYIALFAPPCICIEPHKSLVMTAIASSDWNTEQHLVFQC